MTDATTDATTDAATGATTGASNAVPAGSTPLPGVRAAEVFPAWMGSIRFRLTALYSIVLFGLAAVLVGLLYIGQSRALDDEQVYRQVTVAQPIPGGVRFTEIQVIDGYREVERLANQRSLEVLRNYSLLALLLLFVASLIIGWIVAGRVLKPIGQITKVAQEIQATDLSRRISLGGPPDELRELADTFDDMLGRIDSAFASQKDFIHEASHELRNPLAVIRTNLDVTLADPDATEADLRHTIEVVQHSSERMTRLVDDLLVYARKGALSMQRETLDVSLVVHEMAEEFRAGAAAREVAVVDQAPPGLWVDGDHSALRQALANLLANAVRLSPPQSTIRVRAGSHAPWVWMSVEDDGPGIAEEDRDRIFQRFWRGDPKESRAEGRSGLGLTIVRQIAEAHGGSVELVSSPGHGAVFAIWLPGPTGVTAAPPDGS
jgi:signal transduction histidine kinase